ncbi:protein-tyrosine phosphatase family protein [Undibacterium sp. Ji50W]|uniref:protein-tyrosine phosphatase family protein n=1 Tax=Undibacterium sp. Ji50W TaxID=3413041 RepID=UPI003BF376BB
MHKRPNKNTYWVQAGHLLAGEYPGAIDPAISARKLENFLDCGVRHFIDLTETGELHPYLDQLMALADLRGLQVRHERFAIPDKSIPASPKQMHTILHSLNKALEKQGAVYVHCYGGIGRTCMVIACYLAQTREDSHAALKELDLLWQQMEKKDRWPNTPETPEQLAWVMNWNTHQGHK